MKGALLALLIATAVEAQDLVAALRPQGFDAWKQAAGTTRGPGDDSLRALGICELLIKFYAGKDFWRLDVDGDGRPELVYSGSLIHCEDGAQESMRTIFYATDGGTARVIFEASGLLGHVSRAQPWNAISFILRNDGCCSDPGFDLMWYTPRRVENAWMWQYTTILASEHDLALPKSTYAAPVPFSVTQDRYNLRLAPVVDDTTFDDNLDRRGNTFARYAAGAKGIALAEQTDGTGRVWWFVVMQSAHVDHKAPSVVAYKAGWMSSRFLRRAP